MDEYIKDSIRQIEFHLAQIQDYADSMEERPSVQIMLTSTDKDAVEVNDLVIDVYEKGEDTESVLNICLYDLLVERQNLYGEISKGDVYLKDEDNLYDYRIHILNAMLVNAFKTWKMYYKDLPYEKAKSLNLPYTSNLWNNPEIVWDHKE